MKRGQLDISFGMIFSIMLIIAFIGLAIYVIVMFLGVKKCTEAGFFGKELQDEVDRAWNSDETSATLSFSLPSEIEKVCFINFSLSSKGKDKNLYEELRVYRSNKLNLYYVPTKKACDNKGIEVKHINLNKILELNNPYCIDNKNGKVEMNIEGKYGNLVIIK